MGVRVSVESAYIENDKPSSWVIQLRQATKCNPELRAHLETLLNPPTREVQEWEIKNAEWKEKAAQRKAEEAEHRRSWQEGLAAEVALINSPEAGVMTRSQAYLLEHMRDSSSSSNTWSSSNWSSLVTEFGLSVAQTFRDGAISFWRGYRPTLLSEGAAPNSTPYQVIFGLTGLAIEAKEKPTLFVQMSAEDARNAARYGLLELNGFPEWLPRLFALHARSVHEIVVHEILYELDAPHSESTGNRVLQRFRRGGDWMYEELASPLLTRLEQPVSHLESLQLALTIVQESSVDDELLGALASRRALEKDNEEIAPTWYAVWVGAVGADGKLTHPAD